MASNALNKAQDYLDKLKEKTRIEFKLKEINKELFVKEAELFDEMVMSGVPSLELDMGMETIKFEPKVTQEFALDGPYAGCKWDEIGVFFDWLREIGEDGLIKSKESVHARTRTAFLIDYIKAGGTLPDFIKESPVYKVKFNKSALERSVKGEVKS